MASTGPAEGAPRLAPGAVASAAIGAGALLERLAPSIARAELDWAGLLERLCGPPPQGEVEVKPVSYAPTLWD